MLRKRGDYENKKKRGEKFMYGGKKKRQTLISRDTAI